MLVVNEKQSPGYTWVWADDGEIIRTKRGFAIQIGKYNTAMVDHIEATQSLIQGEMRGLLMPTAIAHLNGLYDR